MVCFVGDNLERDVKGAMAAGLQAVWFHPGLPRKKRHRTALTLYRITGNCMNCLAGKLREAYKILFCIRERMKSVKLSIVVPCYNEKENLPLLLERFNEVIKGRDMEVILVDNGSTDGSADVLRGCCLVTPSQRL